MDTHDLAVLMLVGAIILAVMVIAGIVLGSRAFQQLTELVALVTRLLLAGGEDDQHDKKTTEKRGAAAPPTPPAGEQTDIKPPDPHPMNDRTPKEWDDGRF